MPDAVVVGAGPNGLVAANLLADAGWSVEVLEEQPEPGGAVRHDREVHPDFVNDLFSSFYPLASASPVLARLRLHEHGLRWSHAPHVLAHPLTDDRCAVLSRDIDVTAASLDAFHPGDGDAWRRLHATWERLGPDIVDVLFTPFPPLPAAARLAVRLRAAGGLRMARALATPVRRVGDEEFRGEGGTRDPTPGPPHDPPQSPPRRIRDTSPPYRPPGPRGPLRRDVLTAGPRPPPHQLHNGSEPILSGIDGAT